MRDRDHEYPHDIDDGHTHDWGDLSELEGRRLSYLGSYCRDCGAIVID